MKIHVIVTLLVLGTVGGFVAGRNASLSQSSSEGKRWIEFRDVGRGYQGACPEPEYIETNGTQTFCRLPFQQSLSVAVADTKATDIPALISEWTAGGFMGIEPHATGRRDVNGIPWTFIEVDGSFVKTAVTIRGGKSFQLQADADQDQFEEFIARFRFLQK